MRNTDGIYREWGELITGEDIDSGDLFKGRIGVEVLSK